MDVVRDRPFRPLIKVVVVLFSTTLVAAALAAAGDFVETFWKTTRRFEAWKFDELLLAACVGIAAALVMAVVQLNSLRHQISRAQTETVKENS